MKYYKWVVRKPRKRHVHKFERTRSSFGATFYRCRCGKEEFYLDRLDREWTDGS